MTDSNAVHATRKQDTEQSKRVAASSDKSWRSTIRQLLCFHEIPAWQKDNEYILSGYRSTSGSVITSLASLLYLNNQTINIYSHLLGAFAFSALSFYFDYYILPSQLGARQQDIVVVSIYCCAVAICFALSAIFHLLWNHSHDVSRFCNKLDYLGILVLLWGAGIPTIYYGFICSPLLQIYYWTMTSIIAFCCAIFTLAPCFVTPQFRSRRAGFYAGFGFSSLTSVMHGLVLYGWQVQESRMSLIRLGWTTTVNLMGAFIYAMRIPERWAPYFFDYFGASHQILHAMVMVAAWIHFRGIVEAFHIIRSQDNVCVAV